MYCKLYALAFTSLTSLFLFAETVVIVKHARFPARIYDRKLISTSCFSWGYKNCQAVATLIVQVPDYRVI